MSLDPAPISPTAVAEAAVLLAANTGLDTSAALALLVEATDLLAAHEARVRAQVAAEIRALIRHPDERAGCDYCFAYTDAARIANPSPEETP